MLSFSFFSSLYILAGNPLLIVSIFSHSIGYLFNQMMVSLLYRNILVSCSTIFNFCINAHISGESFPVSIGSKVVLETIHEKRKAEICLLCC